MKRILYYIIILVLICNCTNNSSKKVENYPDSLNNSKQVDSLSTNFQKSIMFIDSFITGNAYSKNIENDSNKIEKFDTSGYRNIVTYYKSEKNDPWGWDRTYYLPLNDSSFVVGDINNDKEEDLIIPVSSEYGASSFTIDYYFFLKLNGKFQFINMYNDVDLGTVCATNKDDATSFDLHEIKDNYLIGECLEWTKDDGHLSPSLHYLVKISIVNGIKLVEKKEIKY